MNPLLLGGLALSGLCWAAFRWGSPASVGGTLRQVLASLLELLLYGDAPRVLGQVLKELLVSNLRLARLWLLPSLLCLVGLAMVCMCLEPRCRWRPPQPGESFLVSASRTGQLEVAPELLLETPRLDSAGKSYWRLVGTTPGRFHLRLNGQSAEVWVGTGWPALYPYQTDLRIYYPGRLLWLSDHLLSWQAGLAVSWLGWTLLAQLLHSLSKAGR